MRALYGAFRKVRERVESVCLAKTERGVLNGVIRIVCVNLVFSGVILNYSSVCTLDRNEGGYLKSGSVGSTLGGNTHSELCTLVVVLRSGFLWVMFN